MTTATMSDDDDLGIERTMRAASEYAANNTLTVPYGLLWRVMHGDETMVVERTIETYDLLTWPSE